MSAGAATLHAAPLAPPAVPEREQEDALVRLGGWLRAHGYRFVTPTPLTHARVLRRAQDPGTAGLTDAFGWSRPFGDALLPPELAHELARCGWLARLSASPDGAAWRSQVRFSSLGDLLLAHSAYPTLEEDAVFFGPDTYRFARFIAQELERRPLPDRARVIDVGCGGGAGGLAAVRTTAGAAPAELLLVDINPRALLVARANARLAGHAARCLPGDLYTPAEGRFDFIVSNPPYLVDDRARAYRHGGGPLGGALSERIVREGLARLAPGGRLLLYTGSAIEAGHDAMRQAVRGAAESHGWPWRYEEIDPDVFGEEIDTPAYAHCDRIAAVGAVIQRPR